MCGSPSTKINPVWREQINPQNTPLESLGLLIGKNLKFEEHSKRICDRIRTIKTQVDRNFANKSEEILEKIDNIYIQSRILYCSQIYHSELDHLVKPIEKAIKNYWKLNQTREPPKDYMWPRLKLILTDLILVHKMYHGKSVMEFESIFKTHDLTSISQWFSSQGAKNLLPYPKWKLVIARNRFSCRTRVYWNFLLENIREMKAKRFKTEAKNHIMKDQQTYLNFGLKINIVGEQEKKSKKKEIERDRNLKRLQNRDRFRVKSRNPFFRNRIKIALPDAEKTEIKNHHYWLF
jgi:hypothetical protein